MNFLAVNAGSGSVKISLYVLPDSADTPLSADAPAPRWTGELNATSPGLAAGKLRVSFHANDGRPDRVEEWSGELPRPQRMRQLLRALWEGDSAVLNNPSEIAAAGHRVVHGGDQFDRAVLVDETVEAAIQRFAAFSPLHNQTSLEGINVVRELLGADAPQFAVFDTAFHRTLPEEAFTYAGPLEWRDRGIRRYGFHGTSYRYSAGRAARLLGRDAADPELRLLMLHLGGGCSLCATVGGRSVDTTMGFTPLDGVAMCTRSGAIDPGILLFLLREGGMDADSLEKLLNKQSGLAGLSGLTGDTRVIRRAAEAGDARARLALAVFNHRLGAGAGAMLASLGGKRPDAFVFTGGIGEGEPVVRAAVCAALGFCGVELDAAKNAAVQGEAEVASAASRVRVLVIPARENWQIARETRVVM